MTFDRSIGRFRELFSLIQGRCAELMYPQMREHAEASGAEFGGVLVGRDGIAFDGALIPWEYFGGYTISI